MGMGGNEYGPTDDMGLNVFRGKGKGHYSPYPPGKGGSKGWGKQSWSNKGQKGKGNFGYNPWGREEDNLDKHLHFHSKREPHREKEQDSHFIITARDVASWDTQCENAHLWVRDSTQRAKDAGYGDTESQSAPMAREMGT